MQTTHGTVELEVKNDIAYMTLNRPDKQNAINGDMQKDLHECWLEVNNNLPIRAVIITGKGKDFVGAIDESEFAEGKEAANPLTTFAHDVSRPGLPDRSKSRPAKPMIVAVNGNCVGKGLRFVSSADIVIAADDAHFYDPHVNVSLSSAEEALITMRLKSAPKGIALRMAYMGEEFKLSAQRAYEIGMVTEVVPKAKLLDRATELASFVKEASPAATRAVVAGFWDVFQVVPYDKGKWYAHVYDQQARRIDGKEGSTAWLEGRQPVWPSLTTWDLPWQPFRTKFSGRVADVAVDVKKPLPVNPETLG